MLSNEFVFKLHDRYEFCSRGCRQERTNGVDVAVPHGSIQGKQAPISIALAKRERNRLTCKGILSRI
jgi:hypothetical protein